MEDLYPAEHYVEIPATADLVALIKKSYDLSVPQGLGIFHFTPEPLTDDEAAQFVRRGGVSTDYIKGRSVKFHVMAHEGRLYAPRRWYDHDDESYRELLAIAGVTL